MHSAAINGRSNPYGHTVRSSSDPYSNGYTHITTPQGMPTPEATEPWSAPMSVTMPSTVSSPASCGPAEDYRYMPTPVSGPLIDPASLPPTSVPFQNHDVDQYDSGVDSGKNRPDPITGTATISTFSRKFAGLKTDTSHVTRSWFPPTKLKPPPPLLGAAVIFDAPAAATMELHGYRRLQPGLPQQPVNVKNRVSTKLV